MSSSVENYPKDWDLSRLVLSAKQTEIARALQAWLAKSPSALKKSIADFAGGEFTPDQMRILEDELFRAFSPLSQATEYLQVLCKIVDAINLNASQPLPLPRIPILAIRPRNPFRDNIPEALQRVRCWRETLANSTASAVDQHQCAAPVLLGKLYTSAVLHGGLAHPDLLVGFARVLADPTQHIIWQKKRICLELSLSWQGEMGSEYRIWYPDPLSAMLIVQFLAAKAPVRLDKTHATDQHLRGEIWTQVNQFFKTTSLKMAERPKTLHQLTRFAKIDLHTRLPQVLVSYAGRKLVSHSLDRRVVSRIHGFTVPAAAKAATRNEAPAQPKDQITQFNQNADDLNDMEPVWLAEMRKALASGEARSVKGKLKIIESKLSKDTIEHCFVRFAIHLVSARSASNNKLALSTSRAYLVTVSKKLGGRLGSVDPCCLGSSALESLYWEILEEASDSKNARSKRKGIARALREFHHFLVQNDHATSIDYREVLGVGKGLVPVNANLITFDDYSKILLQLPASIRILRPNLPHMNKLLAAARLIFILSFKCGLRPMEVLKLKLCDFCEHDPAELLVRPSEARRLKTKNAIRKLPLYALLDESELLELIKWKRARLTELQSIPEDASDIPIQQNFLFGIPELEYNFIPGETLFPILHHAMREVTGDESIRFYNLRHSFASWTLLRLMLSDLSAIPDIFSHLPETTQRLKESADFREKLYGRSDLTRRHVYALASLLGHAGPATSLEHYVHFCDVLLACWLNIDIAAPRKSPLVRQSGMAKSTVYRWASRGLSQVPYMLARRKKQIERSPKSEMRSSGTVLEPSAQSLESMLSIPDFFDKIWEILHRHALNHEPVDELALSSGVPEEMIEKCIKRTTQIASKKTKQGKGGSRHRMLEATMTRGDPDSRVRIACPNAPRTREDKLLAARLAPRFLQVIHEHRELCEANIKYYLDHAWKTQSQLIFKDPDNPEEAKRFLLFLSKLGIKPSEMLFISYDTSDRSSAVALWRRQLGLSWRHVFIKQPPPRKNHKAARNWLGIRPVFERNTDGVNSSEKASSAFRYLMVMAAITWPIFYPDAYGLMPQSRSTNAA